MPADNELTTVRFGATPLHREPERIVKFAGEEGRDRKISPSINAPHTELEALCAVLMSVRRNAEEGLARYSIEPSELYPYAPQASRTQRLWVVQGYADTVRLLSVRIENIQRLMGTLEQANKKVDLPDA